ncbi:fic family toxin-antitoxin system, toxin component [Streptomyces sp. NPDC046984]|uniref:fic family toxin-antitoxin system, toxin component n=1 Tax=Streptomyces sp. NPDC046984 TaxID=3155138 RepID=UPI0034040AAD
MNHPDPQQPHSLDVPYLLHAAKLLPRHPQVDDYGPLYAADARAGARAMERDIYGSLHLKAAAMLQTLARLPALEHSTDAFAWHSCEAYLALNGCHLAYQPKDALVLVREAAALTVGVGRIARQLRAWDTT